MTRPPSERYFLFSFPTPSLSVCVHVVRAIHQRGECVAAADGCTYLRGHIKVGPVRQGGKTLLYVSAYKLVLYAREVKR